MTLTDIIFRLVLAICLGALMGLERDGGWKKEKREVAVKKQTEQARRKFPFIKASIPATNIGGVRTYILLAILGSISGLAYHYGMEALAIAVTLGLMLFVTISFVLNYFDKNSFGLTTEISIILIYLLSLMMFATDIPLKLIVAMAVIVAVILSMKSQFHSMISKFSEKEVSDTLKFILFTLVLLPFLPNSYYGLADIPLIGDQLATILSPQLIEASEIFNPYKMWLVVVFILSINFIGYFLTRMLGGKRGLNMVGLLGGVASSTVVTETMAENSVKVKTKSDQDQLINATLMANMTSFVRVLFLALFINISLTKMLTPPMLTMSAVMVGWVLWSVYVKGNRGDKQSKEIEAIGLNFDSPFKIKPALIFGALFALITVFTRASLYLAGDSGYVVSAMISSIAGLDVVTINTANLAGEGITYQFGAVVMVISASVNLIVKVVLAALVGDSYFRRKLLLIFGVTIAVGLATIALMLI